jgi:hypothetical protein
MIVIVRFVDTHFTPSTDTFSNLTLLNPPSGASSSYNLTEQGIAWPGEAKKYSQTLAYNLSEIIPPPNWATSFPNGYTEDQPPPNFHVDERFQNWMRTAGLPTFTKLYGRNDQDDLIQGRYEITIDMSKSLLRIRYKSVGSSVRSRLSRQIIFRYKVDRDIHRVVDRR